MNMIYVVGIGPGKEGAMTAEALCVFWRISCDTSAGRVMLVRLVGIPDIFMSSFQNYLRLSLSQSAN